MHGLNTEAAPNLLSLEFTHGFCAPRMAEKALGLSTGNDVELWRHCEIVPDWCGGPLRYRGIVVAEVKCILRLGYSDLNIPVVAFSLKISRVSRNEPVLSTRDTQLSNSFNNPRTIPGLPALTLLFLG